jgi:hypothetical protein
MARTHADGPQRRVEQAFGGSTEEEAAELSQDLRRLSRHEETRRDEPD